MSMGYFTSFKTSVITFMADDTQSEPSPNLYEVPSVYNNNMNAIRSRTKESAYSAYFCHIGMHTKSLSIAIHEFVT